MAVGRKHPSPVTHRLAVLAALHGWPLAAMVIPSSRPAIAAHGAGATVRASARACRDPAAGGGRVRRLPGVPRAGRGPQRPGGPARPPTPSRAEARRAGCVSRSPTSRAACSTSLGDLVSPGESDLDRAAEAAANAEDARRLSDMVAGRARRRDRPRPSTTGSAWETRPARAGALEATWTARQVVAAAIRRSQLQAAYAVTDPRRTAATGRALRAWARYLHQRRRGRRRAAAGEAAGRPRPPRPPRLEPVRAAGFRPVHGVAQARLPDGRAVTVLPAETVRAVVRGVPPARAADGARRRRRHDVRLRRPASPTPGAAARSRCPPTSAGQWQDLHRGAPRAALQVGDVVVLGSQQDRPRADRRLRRRRSASSSPTRATGTAGGAQPLRRAASSASAAPRCPPTSPPRARPPSPPPAAAPAAPAEPPTTAPSTAPGPFAASRWPPAATRSPRASAAPAGCGPPARTPARTSPPRSARRSMAAGVRHRHHRAPVLGRQPRAHRPRRRRGDALRPPAPASTSPTARPSGRRAGRRRRRPRATPPARTCTSRSASTASRSTRPRCSTCPRRRARRTPTARSPAARSAPPPPTASSSCAATRRSRSG